MRRFFLPWQKYSGVQRSVRRMPSIALAKEGGWLRIATTIQQKPLTMFYTYILRSIEHPEQRYIGHTADLYKKLWKNSQKVCFNQKYPQHLTFAFRAKKKAVWNLNPDREMKEFPCIIRLYNLPEVLLKYRNNPDSLVHTKKKEMTETDLMIKQRLLDRLTDNKKLQRHLIEAISKIRKKKLSFFEKIFSIRNEWNGLNRNKIIQILGIKINIKHF